MGARNGPRRWSLIVFWAAMLAVVVVAALTPGTGLVKAQANTQYGPAPTTQDNTLTYTLIAVLLVIVAVAAVTLALAIRKRRRGGGRAGSPTAETTQMTPWQPEPPTPPEVPVGEAPPGEGPT